MGKYKNIFFLILLAALFVEILIIFPSKLEHEDADEIQARIERQEKEAQQAGADAAQSSLSDQKMQGVHLVESHSGARDWELFAVSAEGAQGSGTWRLKKVRVLFYNLEKVEFIVTGDEGSIDSKSKDLSVIGNVVTKSENGYVFSTPSIYYSSQRRQIESPQHVSMVGPADSAGSGMSLQGARMKVLVEQSRMLIQDRVSAQKQVSPGKSFDIVADGAEFSGKSREARFLGAVRMSYDKMKLEGPEASLLYGQGMDVLRSVSVKGGVRVSDFDKFATSDSVKLDLEADRYTFMGSPRVVQGGDELAGEEIIFLDGGKKVKVERVRAKVENKE